MYTPRDNVANDDDDDVDDNNADDDDNDFYVGGRTSILSQFIAMSSGRVVARSNLGLR